MTARQSGPEATVVVNLLSLGRLYLAPGEVLSILLHRHLLVLYLTVLFLLVGLDFNGAEGVLGVELRGTIYILSMGSAIAVLALSLLAAQAVAARRGRCVLHLSPVLILATISAVIVGEAMFRLLTPPQNEGVTRLALLFAFHYMIIEFAAAIVCHQLVPLILSELRGLPISKLFETDPALWQEEAATVEDVTDAVDGFLAVAGRSYPFASLVHLQADGNYVHLRAHGQTELLPGPLADLVRQLPQSLGKQVHRSHWVARSALTGWSADGREITLYLATGATVPVAVTRRRELRAWLTALGLPRREGP